jgi:hypothetical protein
MKGGWDMGFLALVIAGAAATILFAFAWNADYYLEEK